MLADDMGYGDISTYGQKNHITPNIDQIAKDGVKFTDFYVPVPYCAPSRATLLTGRFPLRNGLIHNPHPDTKIQADTIGIADSELLLGEVLQNEGYKTKLVGKWHLGHKEKFFPTKHGFDEYYGILYSNDMLPIQIIEDMDTVEYPVDQNLITQKYTAKAIDFIQRNKDEQFFLHLCHTMPHKPLAASSEFYTPETPDNLYDDVIRELDWSVGEIVGELKRQGILNNTIVIFMSDNGGSWGGSTGGLKGMKANNWEGGTRVPFMIMANGLPTNLTVNTPSWSPDIFPTILDMLEIELPGGRVFDGVSIQEIIKGEKKDHGPIFTMRQDKVMTIRSGDWKLFLKKPKYYTGRNQNYRKGWDAKFPNGTTIIAPLEQPTPDQYPGIKPLPMDEFPLLFNVSADTAEMKNMAKENPAKVEELQMAYDLFFESIGNSNN
ncbi:MAG: sulfatase-like hydrolase/transferase [Cyclobacteriaceae bacterium]